VTDIPKKILFRNHNNIGDILCMTAGIKAFKHAYPDVQVSVETTAPALWDFNKYVDPNIEDATTIEIGPKIATNKSNSWHVHLCDAYRICIEDRLNVHIPPVETRPDIYLSQEEIETPIIPDIPYWIITVGGEPNWTAKMYPMDRWQEIINLLKGKIQFVQLQRENDNHPVLDGVIDMTGKTENVRDLINVFYHSQGSIGLVSMHMHLSAAFDHPCVVVAGAREPSWFTHYLGHQYIHTLGSVPCSRKIEKSTGGETQAGCWKCTIESCQEHQEKFGVKAQDPLVPYCVERIYPSLVAGSVLTYYDGGRLKFDEKINNKFFTNIVKPPRPEKKIEVKEGFKLNVLASLSTKGGGEQSICTIVDTLRKAGAEVDLCAWGEIHEDHKWIKPVPALTFLDGRKPTLFYANDQINEFCENGDQIIYEDYPLIIAINYINGKLPRCQWLKDSGKLKAVIFQNREKMEEFKRDSIFGPEVKLLIQPGAINLESLIKHNINQRPEGNYLNVLKHGLPDYRKYITSKSVDRGEKKHVWQKHINKEQDIKFYERLLKDTKDIRFCFMEAHPELEEHFKGEERMRFLSWNVISVKSFLAMGHVYLHRMSDMWRDQYPRVVGEALAAGIPVLSEPRDGTMDRVIHGDTGFHCVDYDQFKASLRLLQRKEKYRQEMGKRAREWAIDNLDPKKWIEVLSSVM